LSRKNKTIVGIDIGTTKVNAIVGEVGKDGVAIIGVSSQPSFGVKKGVIINMDSAVDSIKKALEEVETMLDIDISSAVVGISGSHIKGFSSNGVIPLNNKEVKKSDVLNVIDAAKSFVIPMDREIIHILPQEFIVDNQNDIKDPVGMCGVRLESRVYVITSDVASAQNIVRCTNRSGLKVQNIILHQLASAEAVLTEDEKELGCVLIDIGGGTTDISIFTNGCIRYCSVLPIGGNHITSDIAIGLRTPISEAEEIKKNFGNSSPSFDDNNETIEVAGISDNSVRHISKSILSQIVEARVEETFNLIQKELEASGFTEFLSAGAVLTGGTALLKGINETSEKILSLPVRTGYPQGISGINDVKNPMYSSGVGLILFTANGYMNDFNSNGSKKNLWKTGQKIKEWVSEAF
jgi:cell division protein FtsA